MQKEMKKITKNLWMYKLLKEAYSKNSLRQNMIV